MVRLLVMLEVFFDLLQVFPLRPLLVRQLRADASEIAHVGRLTRLGLRRVIGRTLSGPAR